MSCCREGQSPFVCHVVSVRLCRILYHSLGMLIHEACTDQTARALREV